MKNKIISIGQNHLFSFKNNNKLHPQKNLLAKVQHEFELCLVRALKPLSVFIALLCHK